MHRNVLAPALNPLDPIALIAPSTLLERKLLLSGSEKLAAETGFSVVYEEKILARYRSFAGRDEERAAHVLRAMKDPTVRALWCARGGYGSTRILELLDKGGAPRYLQKFPKPLLGYSDATALILYAYQAAKIRSVHGPMLATPKWNLLPAKKIQLLVSLLQGTNALGAQSYTRAWRTRWLGKKTAVQGVLLGGNLTLLANLAGTPWQPNLKGALLFLEDCAEAPYRVDRMLTQLWNSGMLQGVKAVLAGDFAADVTLKPGEKKSAWQEVFADRFLERGIPVLWNLPIGHGKYNEPLPVGVKARVTPEGKIELLEKIVQS